VAKAGQPAWLTALREAINEGVRPEDVKAIVAKQVEKAKTGDDRAAKWVLDLVSRQPQGPPPVTNATQNVFHIHVAGGGPVTNAADKLRLKALALVEASGPLTAGQIAAQLDELPEAVERAVRHPWFRRNCHGVLSLVKE
jgi:hypothetical protein